MKFDFTFKQMATSDALVDYTQQKLLKLEKFELKPSHAHFAFWAHKHEIGVDILIRTGNGEFRASGDSNDDMYSAVDQAIERLGKQMAKYKSKVQHHKKKSISDEDHPLHRRSS